MKLPKQLCIALERRNIVAVHFNFYTAEKDLKKHPAAKQKGEKMKKYSLEKSLCAWESNAQFWDDHMGDESNRFHREVVRPKVSELLNVQPGDFILDAACGNGNYSAYMAERGADVVAFDYSPKMIGLAKRRQAHYKDKISFHVANAADENSIMSLYSNRLFTKAVSNMAIMDITDITPLFKCLNRLLTDNGIFVFATQHPCFVTLTDRYLTAHSYEGEAIAGQPRKQCYYHRSMQELLNLCFECGFTIDGFYEESYGNKEIPDIIIVRARKK